MRKPISRSDLITYVPPGEDKTENPTSYVGAPFSRRTQLLVNDALAAGKPESQIIEEVFRHTISSVTNFKLTSGDDLRIGEKKVTTAAWGEDVPMCASKDVEQVPFIDMKGWFLRLMQDSYFAVSDRKN